MVSKWWGVGLIVVLGLVWFVLAELPAPAPGATAAGAAQLTRAGDPAQVSSNPTSLRRDESLPADGTQPAPQASGQAAVGSARGGVEAQAVAPVSPAPSSRGGPVPSAPASLPVQSTPPTGPDSLAAAGTLRSAGDLEGAQAMLRRLMQEARSAKEAARAGLLLAPMVGDLAERRQLLSAALLERAVIGAEYEEVSHQLTELNQSPGLTLHPLVHSETYAVVSGDSLWKLCNKTFATRFGVTPEIGLLKLANGLDKDSLRVGQKLVVPTEPVSVRVDAQQHGLAIFLGETAVAAFRVGLGKENRTPRGDFLVRDKQENPAWFFNGRTIPYGDPENILGTRWLGFDDQPGASGFGIHGTADPASIGRNESMGCVRMRNEEVEQLFELVPRGTAVAIL